MALLLTCRRMLLLAMCISEASRCIAVDGTGITLSGSSLGSQDDCQSVVAAARVNLVLTSEEKSDMQEVFPLQQANRRSTRTQKIEVKDEMRKCNDSETGQIESMNEELKSMRRMLDNCENEVHELKAAPHGTREKLLTNVAELKAIHKVMMFRIRTRVLELSGKGSYMISLKAKNSLQKTSAARRIKTNSPKQAELHGPLLDEVKKKVTVNFMQRLNDLLHQIASFKVNEKIEIHDIANHLMLKLQRLVFQTIGYMYKYKLITEDNLRYFFEMKNTLETSALNTILTYYMQMGFPTHCWYYNNQAVLSNQSSSQMMTNLRGLSRRYQRKFLHTCIQVHFTYYYKEHVENPENWINLSFKNEMVLLFYSIFEEPAFFDALESYLQIKLLAKRKQDEFKRLNQDYLRMEKTVKGLAQAFLKIDSQIKFWKINEVLSITFLILDFVKEFYNGVLEIDSIMEDKFRSMGSKIGSSHLNQWYD